MDKIINVAEINSRNIKGTELTQLQYVLKENGTYRYLLWEGGKGYKVFRSLIECRADAQDCYGNWNGFKLLI